MQDLFIELLQVTVGTRDILSRVPSGLEWQSLYEEGQRQAVDSILLDGIERLPENQRPPKAILLQWIGTGEMLKQRNQLLNKACPSLRQCGDIDIWVDGDRAAILSFLRKNGNVGSVDIKHCDWNILQDVPVEVHFIPTWFYNPFTNKKLQNWFKEQKSIQFNNKSELGFTRPNISFNLVYILIHIYRHLFDEGIGLRQLMDYYYVLKQSTVEERQEAMRVLCSLKMKQFVGAAMYVLQKVFQLDDGYLMCQPLQKDGQFLFNEIMRAGNFGQYDERNHRQQGRLANGIENIKRNLRFVSRYPQEVCWMPVWKIWHWCWRKRKGYI